MALWSRLAEGQPLPVGGDEESLEDPFSHGITNPPPPHVCLLSQAACSSCTNQSLASKELQPREDTVPWGREQGHSEGGTAGGGHLCLGGVELLRIGALETGILGPPLVPIAGWVNSHKDLLSLSLFPCL